MQCEHCHLELALEDNFCRRCGTAVQIIEVPALRGEARPLTVWQQARPAVTRGVMLMAAGAMLRYAVEIAGHVLAARAHADDGAGLRRLLPFIGDHVIGDHVIGDRAIGDRAAGQGGDELEILWYRRVRR